MGLFDKLRKKDDTATTPAAETNDAQTGDAEA